MQGSDKLGVNCQGQSKRVGVNYRKFTGVISIKISNLILLRILCTQQNDDQIFCKVSTYTFFHWLICILFPIQSQNGLSDR